MRKSLDVERKDKDPAGSKEAPDPILVDDKGDIILSVTFETSPATLKKSRKAALAANRKPNSQPVLPTALSPKIQVGYRVNLDALKRHSNYFSNLLSNPQFREARLIKTIHEQLASRNIEPGLAHFQELPTVLIVDDDEATQAAGRDHAFEDLLRIIHQKQPKGVNATMAYATTLTIMADRFDCLGAVSRILNTELKFKWPVTSSKAFLDDQSRPTDVEKVLRQKILISWLLGQPLRLNQASRELITRGSRLWAAFPDKDANMDAAWWDLPDGLERELQYRRECILNTIASVQRQFLSLYSSRERQCRFGYDSSAACDSFQLGQMMKFLLSKDLLFLIDYSPMSLEAVPDTASVNVEELLSALKQSPNYQIDKNHVNCGLRLKIQPILDYICSMLSANSVPIPHLEWKRRRADISWEQSRDNNQADDQVETFIFTRAIATDQRLRYEGAMYLDRMARKLFTAQAWNWSPETE